MIDEILPPSPCQTVLLSDAPADEDLLGSHERLAELLATTVTTDEGGKAIALTGAFGSGKSTVVRLLTAALARTAPDTAVMTYDSWGHHADPLRRSFLEELIHLLADHGWLKQQAARDELDLLSHRIENVELTTQPTLTLPGRLVAATSLFVPLGYVLIASSLSRQSRVPANWLGAPTAVWGFLLAVLPLLIATLIYFAWRPKCAPWDPHFWRRHRDPHATDSIMTLFLNKSTERTSSTTYRTPEPTTLEFQATYKQLLNTVLSNPHRQLVLVIDNLDRLPPEQAQQTWATMTTFLDAANSSDTWATRLWLIVPLARQGLGPMWPQFPDGNDPPVFAKTFQAVVDVPPPVLSNWRSFLLTSLQAAFPSHQPNDDLDAIYRLYRLKRSVDVDPPNPRELKLFVNRLGFLHRLWQHQIPLPGRSQVVSATTCENPGDRNQEDVGGDPFDEGAEAAGAPAEGEGAASR